MSLLVDGRTALLEGLIDYAGVFPPASLELEAAVAEYRTARAGPHAWMLGRFLCRTSQLVDLAGILTATMETGESSWGIGAIFDGPPGPAALAAQAFQRHMEPAAQVVFAEVRTPAEAADGRSIDDAVVVLGPIAEAALGVGPDVVPFLEIAIGSEWRTGIPIAVTAIAQLRNRWLRRLGAKLRTGGATADAFPSPEQVAAFIAACIAMDVPFKATAGLHHPVRHHDPAIGVVRHGFLNLLAAAALAAEGAAAGEIVAALEETDPDAFKLTAAGLRLRDRRIGVATLRSLRHERFPAYGSCSFDEPVADLVAMGILGDT